MGTPEQHGPLLKAAASLSEHVARVAATAAALLALAYYAGWQCEAAYLKDLGAPWAIAVVPAATYLHLSAQPLGFTLGIAFICVQLIADGRSKRLLRMGIGLSLLVGATLAVPDLARLWSRVSPEVAWKMASIGSYLLSACAGMLLAAVVVDLADRSTQWRFDHVAWIVAVLGLATFFVPVLSGSHRARYHLAASAAVLPSIKFASATPGQSWFLIDVLGEQALVADLPPATNQATSFRLVLMTDVAAVSPVLPP